MSAPIPTSLPRTTTGSAGAAAPRVLVGLVDDHDAVRIALGAALEQPDRWTAEATSRLASAASATLPAGPATGSARGRRCR